MAKSGELDHPQFRRGIHTAYVGDDSRGQTEAGHARVHKTAVFLHGKPCGDHGPLRDELRKRKLIG